MDIENNFLSENEQCVDVDSYYAYENEDCGEQYDDEFY